MVPRDPRGRPTGTQPLNGPFGLSHRPRRSLPSVLAHKGKSSETPGAPFKRSNRKGHVYSLRRSGSQWPKVVFETISPTDIDRFLLNFDSLPADRTSEGPTVARRPAFVNSLLHTSHSRPIALALHDAWSIRVELDVAVSWFQEFVSTRFATALDHDAAHKAHYFGLLAQRLHTEDNNLAQFCLATKNAILFRPRPALQLAVTDRRRWRTAIKKKHSLEDRLGHSHLLLSQNVLKGLMRAYRAWQDKYDFELVGDNYINDEDDSDGDVTLDTASSEDKRKALKESMQSGDHKISRLRL